MERNRTVRFSLGARLVRCDRIVPVFLPFQGCPGRCVFCAQDRQTGGGSFSLEAALAAAGRRLAEESARGRTCELAFYGGTFTALPRRTREACLEFLDRRREEGLVLRSRCSTRPDFLDGAVLDELAAHGMDLVELGVQSFSDEALELSGRGCTGRDALEACRLLADRKFSFGIQLLPGMPGCGPRVFMDDVETSLALGPACMRFYPCLVPEGTVLARWHREGAYRPWTVERTASVLGMALARAWEERVPVIRLSVAPEEAFDATLLAGPRHPALGALIQAAALLRSVEKAVEALGTAPRGVVLPKWCQGFAFGERGGMKAGWLALGIRPASIRFENADCGSVF